MERWTVAKENIEAWLDVGAMREEVTEHARLMATMNMIMNEAKRTVHFTSTATMRDIGDAAVLRRVRMIQLAAMVNMDKVKLVFARHGKACREKAMGKEDRKADRKTAISILVQALSLALTITLIIYLLPL